MKKCLFDKPEMSPTIKGTWVLMRSWVIWFRGERYEVPKGMETDGASIPRLLWFLCGHPLATPRLYAALLHDFIYGGGDPEATRADADDIFRDIQIDLGVPRWKAYVEWAALRLFGKSHWHKAVIAAVALAFLSGCVEIANVESFVTFPNVRSVIQETQNERKIKNEENHVCRICGGVCVGVYDGLPRG